MKDIYVVSSCRTAIGTFGGSLKDTPAAEMGAIVVKEALNRAGVKPEQVDEVMFGCILTAALGQNVARQVSIKAGFPVEVPAYTVGNKRLRVYLCGLRCEAGTDAAVHQYQEVGTAGTASTVIRWHDAIPAVYDILVEVS